MYADPTGEAVFNIIGAVIGAGGGAALGKLVADHYGLSGWKRNATIAGFSVGGAAVGWFVGGIVEELAMSIAANMARASIGTIAVNQAREMLAKVEPNRINHIIQTKHAWNLVGAKDWKAISQVIKTVLAKGAGTINDAGNKIFTYVYQGQTIVVDTRVVKGVTRIVDAWVKTK